ncbi:argonaute/piwi family protein [Nostoc sp.]
MSIESNVFLLLNLSELATRYRLYEIRGLKRHAEYYQNQQNLIHRLSYLLKHPVTVIEHDDKPYLVVSDDAAEPPERFQIIRGIVYFKSTGKTLTLDYSLRTPQNDKICWRFLHFMVQSSLFGNAQLWQSSAGKPFFEKVPHQKFGAISIFRGFSVRPFFTECGEIGLCVDVQHKFICQYSLPTFLTEQSFQQYKAKHCIYHYGHQWYEIQLSELSDLNAMEQMVPDGNNLISLLDYIIKHSRKPIPEDLASISQDAAVVHYFNNQNEDRAAIAALCYLVYDTADPAVQKYHSHTILKPGIRYFAIHQLVDKYLREIKFGKITLKVACIPEQVSQKIFTLPDYRFGNNHRLSVRGTKGTMQVTLDQVGRKRLELLSSQKAGMYVQEPFDRQYLLLPQTVGDSFGSEFVQDLTKTVDQLYPAGGGYKPQIIYYPDRGFRTYIEQGRAILQTVEDHRLQPGYGIVMLNYTPTFARQHDPLAALVVRKLKEYDLYVATIHSATGKDCYELKYNKHGQPFYAMRSQKRGKLLGYLRAVGLNKILLTNERWPFVLDTPLHADVTIGIDVKHHTAGYIVVNKYGSRIWTLPPVTSKQQEQLSKEQITTCLIEILTREVEQVTYSLLNIVIHRDGRVYDCEIEGAKQAITVLKAQGVLSQDVTLTILEISKSAPASLRLFDVVSKEGQNINNINIGFYRIINNDGYLCSTGQPFSKQGTVKPLHVKYIEGTLSFELCLEDIHYLTALTWTKPDDCSRYPITTKLNDRRLSEDASEYDEDALKFDFLEDIESEVMSDENADNEQSREEIIS